VVDNIQPVMGQIANISLALMLVLMLGLNIDEVLSLFGSGAILAILLLIAVGLSAGYFLVGRAAGTRRVLALGTGQRNIAAAFVIGTGSFADRPDVLVLLAAAGLVSIIVMMPVAGEFARRNRAGDEEAARARGEAAVARAEQAGQSRATGHG
jgi:BASS family bile acid:Na+ symporter